MEALTNRPRRPRAKLQCSMFQNTLTTHCVLGTGKTSSPLLPWNLRGNGLVTRGGWARGFSAPSSQAWITSFTQGPRTGKCPRSAAHLSAASTLQSLSPSHSVVSTVLLLSKFVFCIFFLTFLIVLSKAVDQPHVIKPILPRSAGSKLHICGHELQP